MQHKWVARGADEHPQITYYTARAHWDETLGPMDRVLIAVSKDKIGREIGMSVRLSKSYAEKITEEGVLLVCDRLAYSIIQRRDKVLQCEQCGKELDEETVEVCDECGGIFCQMHINVMDNDDILCDTCAIEREREEGTDNANTEV